MWPGVLKRWPFGSTGLRLLLVAFSALRAFLIIFRVLHNSPLFKNEHLFSKSDLEEYPVSLGNNEIVARTFSARFF